MIGEFCSDIQVIRNDEMAISEIALLPLDGIVLSPGPGNPLDAGICIDVVKEFSGKIPILGVCLGHQSICTAFGMTISHAKQLMHGKQSTIQVNEETPLFRDLPRSILGARYHSLAAVPKTIKKPLMVTAQSEDGEIMAVQHKEHKTFGIQFHPESILTPYGRKIIKNFLAFKN